MKEVGWCWEAGELEGLEEVPSEEEEEEEEEEEGYCPYARCAAADVGDGASADGAGAKTEPLRSAAELC